MNTTKGSAEQDIDDTLSETEKLTRRDFLKVGLGALTATAAIEIGVVGFMFLRSRSLEGEFGSLIKAGEVDSFLPGTVTEFAEENFFLVRSREGGFLAIYRRCPHLGCTVNWNSVDEHFLCPCHASKFDIYGDFESQPVPRALDIFPVTIDEQMVTVDTSQLERRENFSPDQLVFQ
jgi:cytochrome b6-f complex iron-sulfur subunit